MLHVTLFGRFSARHGDRVIDLPDGSRVQALFAFLLLQRTAQPREQVASLFWDRCSTASSKAYLRKAIWQLQHALRDCGTAGAEVLRVDGGWIQLDPAMQIWSDVAAFERAYTATRGVAGSDLDAVRVRALEEAALLYTGDLLANCYEEWCLSERERLRQMQLIVLDKLAEHCEAHARYEEGIFYSLRILTADSLREHAHRRLMHFHWLRGDRTSALKQYHVCHRVLEEELGVEPMRETRLLFEQVRDGTRAPGRRVGSASAAAREAMAGLLNRLHILHEDLVGIEDTAEAVARGLDPGGEAWKA